ncbi:unnamed protein product [Acanthosepion pharaonis]|uniref:Uncharacterized protein n=1 Tax=Acanthosepion pharaonis TaxID=158019 RepID=A0A812DPY6_ACAPH|nr:unnamed protein product [Sepia pharaonis]
MSALLFYSHYMGHKQNTSSTHVCPALLFSLHGSQAKHQLHSCLPCSFILTTWVTTRRPAPLMSALLFYSHYMGHKQNTSSTHVCPALLILTTWITTRRPAPLMSALLFYSHYMDHNQKTSSTHVCPALLFSLHGSQAKHQLHSCLPCSFILTTWITTRRPAPLMSALLFYSHYMDHNQKTSSTHVCPALLFSLHGSQPEDQLHSCLPCSFILTTWVKQNTSSTHVCPALLFSLHGSQTRRPAPLMSALLFYSHYMGHNRRPAPLMSALLFLFSLHGSQIRRPAPLMSALLFYSHYMGLSALLFYSHYMGHKQNTSSTHVCPALLFSLHGSQPEDQLHSCLPCSFILTTWVTSKTPAPLMSALLFYSHYMGHNQKTSSTHACPALLFSLHRSQPEDQLLSCLPCSFILTT